MTAMQKALTEKRDAEFAGIMEKFFPGPVTDREKELFDYGHSLCFTHCLEYIRDNFRLVLKEPPKVN